ncbi:MAG: hypothetical protein CM15mP32_4390 [Flavobacteriaceae bacterium]|nr:MAG: hypothetical protein CM15mP32_4390 [Flavobacteriaceae bacterium]
MFIASMLLWVFIQNGSITAIEGFALVYCLFLCLSVFLRLKGKVRLYCSIFKYFDIVAKNQRLLTVLDLYF